MSSDFATVFNDSNPAKMALAHYTDKFIVSEKDTNAKPNFINMSLQSRNYSEIPVDCVPQVMELLNTCHGKGLWNHFYEIQDVTKNERGEPVSGLIFEFKFDTDESIVPFDTVVQAFIKVLFRDILQQCVKFSKDNELHHCFYLASPKPVFDPRTLKYRSYFRVVIPGIMLTPDVRFFISVAVYRSKPIQALFKQRLNGHTVRSSFHRTLRSAPVTLLGSCGPDQDAPLNIVTAYAVYTENGQTDGDSFVIHEPFKTFPNLVADLSINYPSCSKSPVKKRAYATDDQCFMQLDEILMIPQERFQIEYDVAMSDYIKMSVYDKYIMYVYDYLKLLSKEYFSDLDKWIGVIRAIASKGPKYKCLAIVATAERNRKLVSWEQFEEYWNNAINDSDRIKYSINVLRFWAMSSSPSKMECYIDNIVQKIIVQTIRDPIMEGHINHSQVAECLHFLFGNDYLTCKPDGKNVSWFEFVTPETKDVSKGQIYKWRNLGEVPDTMVEYMSSKLHEIAVRVHKDLHNQLITAKEKEGADDSKSNISRVLRLLDNFKKSMRQVGSMGFKMGAIKDATSKFRQNAFMENLDRVPHLLGVGNGVIEFNGPDVKLLDHYHTYPISLHTDTNYIEYDEENFFIKEVYRFLRSLFPEDEEDALHFVLYYFSTSLDWLPKEALFFIIHGGGCHAIDTPIRMFDGSIKMVQNVAVGDKLMGDDNTPRVVQELFRGEDEMFRICPIKGESFEVNQHHVLSVKFIIGTSIVSGNTVVRYQYNGIKAPIQSTIEFASEDEAKAYLSTLVKDQTTIFEGDNLDIAVVDVLKWSNEWKMNIAIYKSIAADNLLPGITIEAVGRGNYYGFELDGNHRYLTGDYIVHHNSNGKSVIMELFRATLGNKYARKMQLSFITDCSTAKSSAADPSIMDLQHARVVYYSESEKNERVNVSKIKELTGGETISGRQLYGEQKNFNVNCNHIVTTNYRFSIQTTDHAVWRRFMSYRFKLCFVKGEPTKPHERARDTEFTDRIKTDKRYHEAFLSILIHYRSKLYEKYGGRILKVPHPTIERETEEYRQSEDIYQRYIMQKVYYYAGRQQHLEQMVSNFRGYCQIENGTKINELTANLVHIFRNSTLAPYIIEEGGIFMLENLYTIDDKHETVEPGSVLFSEWIKRAQSTSES